MAAIFEALVERIIPKEVEKVFDKHELRILDCDDSDGTYDFELEGFTDGGGEMIHNLRIDVDDIDSVKAWYKAFNDVYEDFDPWHEAFIWCDESGVPQNTPFNNGEDLFNDVKSYEEDTLSAIDDDLFDLVFAR